MKEPLKSGRVRDRREWVETKDYQNSYFELQAHIEHDNEIFGMLLCIKTLFSYGSCYLLILLCCMCYVFIHEFFIVLWDLVFWVLTPLDCVLHRIEFIRMYLDYGIWIKVNFLHSTTSHNARFCHKQHERIENGIFFCIVCEKFSFSFHIMEKRYGRMLWRNEEKLYGNILKDFIGNEFNKPSTMGNICEISQSICIINNYELLHS